MRARLAICVLAACLSAGAAGAALNESLVPKPRPWGLPRLAPVFGPTAETVRPRPRPVRKATLPAPKATLSASSYGVVRSPIPPTRPARVTRVVAVTPERSQPARIDPAKDGAICGSRQIRGQTLSPIQGKLRGCGVDDPVRVTSVAGVALRPAAVMDCRTAKTLTNWVEKGAKPSIKRLGGGLESMRVAASYSCRTRNSQPGAKISEHGKGKAIDISAFNLKNGKTISVLTGWGRGADGKVLKRMHKSACGPFGTVLGPNADRFHRDHFHFDTAGRRSAAYCR